MLTKKENGKMKFTERKKKLDYLLEMIEKGRCISLRQTANQFEVSKRTVKRMIAELREEGHPIKYCRLSGKFCLEEKNRNGTKIVLLVHELCALEVGEMMNSK